MKIKSYFIIVFLCMFTLLFATNFIFAGNIGRSVYGIFTDNYNGVLFNGPASNEDSIVMEYMQNMACDTKYTVKTDTYTDIAPEGKKYWQFEVNGTGNWGWAAIGIKSSNTGELKDMHEYYGGKIKFLARATDSDMEYFKVGIKVQDANGNPFEIAKAMGDFSSFSADGQWHECVFDLTTATDANLTQANLGRTWYPFLFLGGDTSKTLHKTIDIDYIRWVKTDAGSFNVTVKNRSDNQVPADDKITWTQSAYRQSWTAAEQYIELDLDKESYNGSYNWYVRIYLNNGKATRTGLYCVDSDGSEIVLPMAWRVRPDLLPNAYGDTLQIARYTSGACGLYDSGKNPNGTDWYSWCPMREVKNGLNFDDVVVWNLVGIHTMVWTHDTYDPLSDYADRKPKIYFAADCSNAIGGLEYEANVVTELVYE